MKLKIGRILLEELLNGKSIQKTFRNRIKNSLIVTKMHLEEILNIMRESNLKALIKKYLLELMNYVSVNLMERIL